MTPHPDLIIPSSFPPDRIDNRLSFLRWLLAEARDCAEVVRIHHEWHHEEGNAAGISGKQPFKFPWEPDNVETPPTP